MTGSQQKANNGKSLSERLSELKAAKEAGLLSDSEYEAKRTQLINEL